LGAIVLLSAALFCETDTAHAAAVQQLKRVFVGEPHQLTLPPPAHALEAVPAIPTGNCGPSAVPSDIVRTGDESRRLAGACLSDGVAVASPSNSDGAPQEEETVAQGDSKEGRAETAASEQPR
jgi:hypothetical protein